MIKSGAAEAVMGWIVDDWERCD